MRTHEALLLLHSFQRAPSAAGHSPRPALFSPWKKKTPLAGGLSMRRRAIPLVLVGSAYRAYAVSRKYRAV